MRNLALDESVLAIERRVVGMDHQEAGALIATKWNLGPNVEGILRHHHAEHTPDELRTQLATVRLADALMHDLQIGYREGAAPLVEIRDEDRAAIGLEGEAWNDALAELGTVVKAAIEGVANL